MPRLRSTRQLRHIVSQNTMLPLWRHVVFVDWHGVLSRDPFWSSILLNERHPYYERLLNASGRLFRQDVSIVKAWMRGKMTAADIVSYLDVRLDRRCHENYLLRRLLEDCRKMKCDSRLVSALQEVHGESFVVLATDNMDCFWESMIGIRDLTSTVDAVLTSSKLGVLKSDDVRAFFGPWLLRHRLGFSDALLLDDSKGTCSAFRAVGGNAAIVESSEEAENALRAWKSCWGLHTQKDDRNRSQLGE